MEYIIFLVLLVCAYLYGVRIGKQKIIKILNIPKGSEIASIGFRPKHKKGK